MEEISSFYRRYHSIRFVGRLMAMRLTSSLSAEHLEQIQARFGDLLSEGRLPERVTHNDTKINNVLLDAATGEGLCVIDLDTVMPGLSLYDFGDLVRSAAATGAEDEAESYYGECLRAIRDEVPSVRAAAPLLRTNAWCKP